MKLKAIFTLGLLSVVLLFAAPLRNFPLSLSQPDGSEIVALASGDEFHNWLHDKDNFTIVQNDAGWYVYARQDGEGLAPTELRVGSNSPAERGLQPGLNLSRTKIAAKYARWAQMQDYSNGKSPHSGQFNNIVIFIKFADDPEFSNPIGTYESIFNTTENNANSMKNYFLAASYQQLNIDTSFFPAPNGTIVVSVTDINPRAYYRVWSNTNPLGYDENDDNERTQREQQMLARAVTAVENQIPTSLDIDGDDDGHVDNTCFIIQGAPDGWAELLWPHRWVLYAADATIHGAAVWDFNFQLEFSLYGEGASVLAHEMFHSLGAPDLYRYEDTSIDPIGNWDLMCANLNPPQHMSAWMKYKYGQWLPAPPTITESGTYSLSPVASSSTNNIYRIPSWKANEYYVLEYRRPTSVYDDNLPGTGLLVYRQDSRYNGNASGPPDELYIYRPGSNSTTTQGSLSMAAFSVQNNRTEMNETTVPSGFTRDNLSGGLNLYEVGVAGETITFKLKISDVQLTSPKKNDVWFFGASKNITWKAKSSSGNVKIEYSTDLGQNYTQIVASAPNSGNFLWTGVPYLDSNQCLIRLTLLSNNQSDTSTYPFSIMSELATPVASYPANQTTGIPTNPQLSWQAVPGATGYQVQLSIDSQFASYVVNLLNHPTNSYLASGLTPFTTYYWRVASIADVGISPFCDTVSFTTGQTSELPAVPVLLSPAHYAGPLPLEVNFSWESSYLASSYRVQIARDAFFSDLVSDTPNLANTNWSFAGLAPWSAFYWRVASVNVAGQSNFSMARRFSTGDGSANDDENQITAVNALETNFPNPFNPHTTISFSVKDGKLPASLVIYNSRGQKVKELFRGIPGTTQLNLVWDGRDEHDQPVSSGVYLYRMQSGDFAETHKMLLAK